MAVPITYDQRTRTVSSRRVVKSGVRQCRNSSLFTPALLRTYPFVFFAVHETRRIFFRPFISKASRRVSSFFLRVQLSQPYVATGHTSAFISCIFVEICMQQTRCTPLQEQTDRQTDRQTDGHLTATKTLLRSSANFMCYFMRYRVIYFLVCI